MIHLKQRAVEGFMMLGKNRKYYLSNVLIWVSFSLFGQVQIIKQNQNDFKNQDLERILGMPAEDTFEVQELIRRADAKFFLFVDPDSMYFFYTVPFF